MEVDKLKLANELLTAIDKLTAVQKKVFDPKSVIGVSTQHSFYGQYYNDFWFDNALNDKCIAVIKAHISEKLPLLQKQLDEL